MKVYTGLLVNNNPVVTVKNDGGPHRELKSGPSIALRNHSPDGFNWGYSGSGPSQLALALLLDTTGDKPLSLALYQQFKSDVVSQFGSPWSITSETIEKWVAENKRTNNGTERNR